MDKKFIVRLRLYRFQSYKDETITFDPKLNAIIGKTDSGKSAITRALFWALYNRPVRRGRKETDEFITWGHTHGFVTVTFSDGTEITRGLENDENYYVLKKSDGTSKKFKGFGFIVPEEILKAHGMYQVDLDDGDSLSLNVSQQLDPVFLFSESGAKRAKTVGIISGADKIDGALGIINTKYKDAANRKKVIVKAISELTGKLEALDYVVNLEDSIKTLDGLLYLLSNKLSIYNKMSNTITRLQQFQSQREELLLLMQYEESIWSVFDLITQLQSVSDRHRDLLEIHEKIENLEKNIQQIFPITAQEPHELWLISLLKELEDRHNKMRSLYQEFEEIKSIEKKINAAVLLLRNAKTLDQVSNIIDILEEKTKQSEALLNAFGIYSTVMRRQAKGLACVSELSMQLRVLQGAYQQLLRQVKKCPVCMSEINPDQISNIIL